MLDINCVYIATSNCGEKFRIIFTGENNVEVDDPQYAGCENLECYDENYIRYIYSYYYDNLKTEMYGILSLRQGYPSDYEDYEVTIEKEIMPLKIDGKNQLCVYDSILMDYELWHVLLPQDKLSQISPNGSKNIKTNVLELKKLKTTGNYRCKIMIMDDNNFSRKWMLLLGEMGEILKKSEIFE